MTCSCSTSRIRPDESIVQDTDVRRRSVVYLDRPASLGTVEYVISDKDVVRAQIRVNAVVVVIQRRRTTILPCIISSDVADDVLRYGDVRGAHKQAVTTDRRRRAVAAYVVNPVAVCNNIGAAVPVLPAVIAESLDLEVSDGDVTSRHLETGRGGIAGAVDFAGKVGVTYDHDGIGRCTAGGDIDQFASTVFTASAGRDSWLVGAVVSSSEDDDLVARIRSVHGHRDRVLRRRPTEPIVAVAASC